MSSGLGKYALLHVLCSVSLAGGQRRRGGDDDDEGVDEVDARRTNDDVIPAPTPALGHTADGGRTARNMQFTMSSR